MSGRLCCLVGDALGPRSEQCAPNWTHSAVMGIADRHCHLLHDALGPSTTVVTDRIMECNPTVVRNIWCQPDDLTAHALCDMKRMHKWLPGTPCGVRTMDPFSCQHWVSVHYITQGLLQKRHVFSY
jgi:hypothetical protein